ncbi:hypothetical protein E4U56_003370 [Claviceps arundinis]|uniref:2EXR domain-containing protein n=1 Tax=Claviceps arundinis TaxID=1623583 RepID=A0A9P7MZK9_9HYPO|nr:hypothetical protein E4U56_003370 [Claviceps arundinis]
MYSDEPMSTDKTSNAGYDANINPSSHLRLIGDEAEVSGEVCGIQGGDTAPGAFPQFMQLPPELRQQIWHFYCPDLIVKARVLPFRKWPGPRVSDSQNDCFIPDYHLLADHTRNLRTMLSTHRESRRIAMRKYPDELVMNAAPGTSIVRFRKETDVTFFRNLSTDVDYSVPDFGNKIENLAVESVDNSEGYYEGEDLLLRALPALKRLFHNLRRLFSYQPSESCLPSRGDWITFEYVHRYTAAVKKDYGWGPGLVEHTNTLYCWPDLDTYPDLVRSLLPRICLLETMDEAGVELWPLVRFRTEISMKAYDMMRRQSWPSSENGDDSSEANQAIENGSEAVDHDSEAIDSGSDNIDQDNDAIDYDSDAIDHDSDEIDRDSDAICMRKRKGIIVGTDVEEEAEIDHDDDGGGPKKKRARQSRPILGFDEKEEGEAEDYGPTLDPLHQITPSRQTANSKFPKKNSQRP